MVDMKKVGLEVILTFLEWEDILTSPPFNFTVQHSGDYALIKYDMRKTDMTLPAVLEARGIIIDKRSMRPVCRPFKKFFNKGEEQAPELGGNEFLVEEKVDGSFIKVWKNKGRMRVSTNGTIDAFFTPLSEMADKSFGELFKETVGDKWEKLDSLTFEGVTHMFELVSPYNRVVIEHPEPEVYYLGSRMNESGNEYHSLELMETFKHPKREVVRVGEEEDYSSLQEYLEEIMPKLEKEDTEGLVISDLKGNRVKVKTRNYLDRHYQMTGMSLSKTSLLRVVLEKEVPEVLSVRPELEEPLNIFEEVKKDVEQFIESESKQVIEGQSSRKGMFLNIENGNYTDAEKMLIRESVSKFLKGEEFNIIPSKRMIRAIIEVYENRNGEIKYEI